MNYHDNFDEFGNLREDHSHWTLRDALWCFAIVGVLAILVSGVLV